MNYTYNWLNLDEKRYLLVWAAAKLVFVGGPDDDLQVAGKLLRDTDAHYTLGAIPVPISAGMTALLTGAARILPANLYTVTGTTFQRQVYAALRSIPYGQTVTYSQLADKMQMPSAVRAIAHAVASNPLLVVQPCHRVVPKAGGTGQYRGGKKMKESLIALESQFA
ncbi:methylated-DNA--[protein]-cysteine S-methyltransferase [Lacticaseibacillus hulanensis]|uniref:methylated-DNA--[protein]-cysteine S-methyltransferase n=1 Tax=Lacticaseibacillus hulanensis TaxID=2493111 RepID=UPI000FDA363F|nr:MGMT family protein [Lacticaseibacillus hulanensis]